MSQFPFVLPALSELPSPLSYHPPLSYQPPPTPPYIDVFALIGSTLKGESSWSFAGEGSHVRAGWLDRYGEELMDKGKIGRALHLSGDRLVVLTNGFAFEYLPNLIVFNSSD